LVILIATRQGTTLTMQSAVSCKMLLPDHHTTKPRL